MRQSNSMQRQIQTKRANRLAELVANGSSVAQAGRNMGLTKGQVMGLWERIKIGLGAQAQ